MVQGQLDDSTEFGDLLELQEQIRALQTELAEVKQADDEELDKLLDQNGVQATKSCCISICWYFSLQYMSLPAQCRKASKQLSYAATVRCWYMLCFKWLSDTAHVCEATQCNAPMRE